MTEEERQELIKRRIIGLTEYIEIFGNGSVIKRLKARIDTGATRSSIDSELAKKLMLGPVIRTKMVKQAQGHTIRPIVMVKFRLAGGIHVEEFTIADRKHMKYSVLIGQNALKNGYLIDPNKK